MSHLVCLELYVDCPVLHRDIYDKMRADLRLMKEEAQRIETSRAPKVSPVIPVTCHVIIDSQSSDFQCRVIIDSQFSVVS